MLTLIKFYFGFKKIKCIYFNLDFRSTGGKNNRSQLLYPQSLRFQSALPNNNHLSKNRERGPDKVIRNDAGRKVTSTN